MLRQELLKQKGISVSQRTVERAVQPWREALRQSAQATVRYETRPGKQLQADFGELWVPIGGVRTKVHFCLLTLGYSRRQLIRVYRQQQLGTKLWIVPRCCWNGFLTALLPYPRSSGVPHGPRLIRESSLFFAPANGSFSGVIPPSAVGCGPAPLGAWGN